MLEAESHLEEQAEGCACVLRSLAAVDNCKQRSDTNDIRVFKGFSKAAGWKNRWKGSDGDIEALGS